MPTESGREGVGPCAKHALTAVRILQRSAYGGVALGPKSASLGTFRLLLRSLTYLYTVSISKASHMARTDAAVNLPSIGARLPTRTETPRRPHPFSGVIRGKRNGV